MTQDEMKTWLIIRNWKSKLEISQTALKEIDRDVRELTHSTDIHKDIEKIRNKIMDLDMFMQSND